MPRFATARHRTPGCALTLLAPPWTPTRCPAWPCHGEAGLLRGHVGPDALPFDWTVTPLATLETNLADQGARPGGRLRHGHSLGS